MDEIKLKLDSERAADHMTDVFGGAVIPTDDGHFMWYEHVFDVPEEDIFPI